eukprot:EG_transcript_35529
MAEPGILSHGLLFPVWQVPLPRSPKFMDRIPPQGVDLRLNAPSAQCTQGRPGRWHAFMPSEDASVWKQLPAEGNPELGRVPSFDSQNPDNSGQGFRFSGKGPQPQGAGGPSSQLFSGQWAFDIPAPPIAIFCFFFIFLGHTGNNW